MRIVLSKKGRKKRIQQLSDSFGGSRKSSLIRSYNHSKISVLKPQFRLKRKLLKEEIYFG
jgi:hypothetical protein